MSESKEPTLPLGVNRIKEFSFTINEALYEEGKLIRIQFQHQTHFNEELNIVDLTLRVIYVYDITKVFPDTILVDIHVQNIFTVPNLRQYLIKDKGFFLPQGLIISMVSLSISHTRALLSNRVAGTIYQHNNLPLINPTEVAKSFYPNMFLEEEKSISNVVEEKISKSRNKKS
ncbi:MAG: hypothetical protein JWQ09_4630 [Segetibacter sp.]|nr:hypothetical protein [Segetibacter sp.]